MNQMSLRITYGAWLFTSVVVLSWFDYVSLTALTHLSVGPGGQLAFATRNPTTGGPVLVYPFTYGAAMISLVGVTYYIFKAEKRRWWALPVGFLAARGATLGMINLYEQVFSISQWWAYYGKDVGTIMWTILGVTWVFMAIPWWRKKNIRPGSACFASYLIVMLIWLLVGHPIVESGSLVAYMLNAASRIFSQTTQVILVRN